MRKRVIVSALCIVTLMLMSTLMVQAKTAVTVLGTGQFTNIVTSLLEQFNKQNPNIEASYMPVGNQNAIVQKMTAAIAGDVAPDLVLLSPDFTYPFIEQNALVPLDQLAARDNYSLRDIPPALLLGGKDRGNLYLIPINLGYHGAVFYNEELAEQAGVNIKLAVTAEWDTLLNLAKKMTKRASDGTLQQAGLDVRSYYTVFASLLFSNGGSLMNEGETAFTFAGKEGLESVEYLADLIVRSQVTNYNNNQFNNGKSAMVFAPTGTIGTMEKNPIFRWGITMPVKKVTHGSWGGAWSLMIPSASKNREAAWQVLKYLAATEAILKMALDQGLPPTRMSVAQNREFRRATHWEVVGESLQYVQVVPNPKYHQKLTSAIGPGLNDVLRGAKSAQELLSTALESLKGLLQ